jgi:organic radical activating enzyme
MGKKFDPVARVALEQQPGSSLNSQVLDHIQGLEKKARDIAARGGDPRAELQDEITNLSDGVTRAHQRLAENHRQAVEEAKQSFERERDRKPEKEIAQIRRAENKIGAMDAEDVKKLAMQFMDGGDLTDAEANVVAQRLQASGEDAHYASFKDAMAERHVNQPWLRNPDVAEIAKAGERYAAVPPGKVVTEDDQVVHVESLIDFEGELDR